MVHPEEFSARAGGVNPRGRRERRPGALRLAVAAAALALPGCDGDTTQVPLPPFGQVGEVRIDVELPLAQHGGSVEGTLVWRSDGRWVLAERIFYEGRLGDEATRASRGNPGDLVAEYASLIVQLSETPGLRLRGEVPEDLNPACAAPRSRVTFAIHDELRRETSRWVRCAGGAFDLFNVTPAGAGPDPGAARVITAVQLVRAITLGDGARSVYQGSLPFAAIGAGEDSPARPTSSRAFVSADGAPPPDWEAFWNAHAPGVPLPEVAWAREMVLLATPGLRPEAGHGIRVRRVLPVGTATRVESLWTIPGDFCAPAARDRHPFHLVVAPLGPEPVSFAEPGQFRFPCG